MCNSRYEARGSTLLCVLVCWLWLYATSLHDLDYTMVYSDFTVYLFCVLHSCFRDLAWCSSRCRGVLLPCLRAVVDRSAMPARARDGGARPMHSRPAVEMGVSICTDENSTEGKAVRICRCEATQLSLRAPFPPSLPLTFGSGGGAGCLRLVSPWLV